MGIIRCSLMGIKTILVGWNLAEKYVKKSLVKRKILKVKLIKVFKQTILRNEELMRLNSNRIFVL